MTTMLTRPVPSSGSQLAVSTVPDHRLRVVEGEDAAGTYQADATRPAADADEELLPSPPPNLTALLDDGGPDQPVVISRNPVQPTRREAMSFLPGLPAMLARPVAAVADTSAALLALPGRLVGLVTSAEQTLAAAHTAVARTEALLDRVEPTVRRLTDTTGP